MIQNLNELKSWQDIKDAEISSNELDILDTLQNLEDEIRESFNLIKEQILYGTDLEFFYLIAPQYFEENFKDFWESGLKGLYYSKLCEIYDECIIPYLNVDFYKGKNNSDFDTIYSRFSVFYNMFFGYEGRRMVEEFFYNYDDKKGPVRIADKILKLYKKDKYNQIKEFFKNYFVATRIRMERLLEFLKEKKEANLSDKDKIDMDNIMNEMNTYIECVRDWEQAIEVSESKTAADLLITVLRIV